MAKKYKEAETYLKDYLTGKLEAKAENRKLEILHPPKRSSKKDLRKESPDPKADSAPSNDRMEREVLRYVDDGTYVFLRNRINIVKNYLDLLAKTKNLTYKILILYYYENHDWGFVADEIGWSVSTCKRRRRNALIELQEYF